MKGLLELVARRAKGRVVKWLRLVKQPKYLIGLTVALAYYGWIIFGRMLNSGQPSAPAVLGGDGGELVSLRLVAAIGVAAFLSIAFLLPSRQPLAFDESEIQYLFTAPVGRRSLIRYALLKAQPGILFGSLIPVLFLGRGPILHRALNWPGTWALFTAWFLCATAIGLFKARTFELPVAVAWRRRLLAWGLLATYWALIAWLGRAAWLAANDASSGVGAWADMRRGLASSLDASVALRVLVAPFEAPFLALWPASGLERAVGWAALALIVVALCEYCARSPVLFEDMAIERAQKVSEIKTGGVAALRRKTSARARQRTPFTLTALGRPEVAVTWKNLLMARRRRLAHSAAWVAVSLLAILAVSVALGAPIVTVALTAVAGLSVAFIVTLSAGALWRNDLRVDLLHVDQLRAWPIPSTALMAAEIATPSISGAIWNAWALGLAATAPASALLASALGLGDETSSGMRTLAAGLELSPWPLVLFGTLAVFILASALTLLGCALQNATVLLLPGWSRLGPQRAAGAAMAGQQALLGLGRLIAMMVGMLPGAIVVGLLLAAHGMLGIPFFSVELPIFALILAAPLLAETWLLVLLCARLWDRLDPSRDLVELSSP